MDRCRQKKSLLCGIETWLLLQDMKSLQKSQPTGIRGTVNDVNSTNECVSFESASMGADEMVLDGSLL